MREIEFRGKRVFDGEWIYGSLHISRFKDNPNSKYYVSAFLGNYTFDHEVVPETVGQYSGWKDMNDVKIWEGDVASVEIQSGEIWQVVCRFGTIQRKMDTGWLVDIVGFYFERPDGLNSLPIVQNYLGKHDLEIMHTVGNVFDGAWIKSPTQRPIQ